MSIFTRNRLVTAGAVAGFVAVMAGIGAVSRSSPTAAAPNDTNLAAAAEALPYVPWYWTMVVAPSDEDVLVLATSKGLYRSTDAGKSWRATGPKNVHVTSLVQAGDSLFMGGLKLGPQPNPNPIIRKNGSRTAPDGPAAVAVSDDDGKSWQELKPRGLPKATVQALAVDPANTGSLFALLNDGRFYRSDDGARSFRLASPKLGIAPYALTVVNDGRFLGGDMDGGGFVSPNAKQWKRTPFTDSEGEKMVMEYAVHPSDFRRVLMSSMGILLSTDGGMTWRIVLKTPRLMFGPIAFAPSDPDTAYAVDFDRALWRSEDGGESWKKVS